MDLFDYMRETEMKKESPLASRMRPETLEEVVGQKHIIGRDRLLYRAIKADKLGSVIFYGPPGTGKTTLARVIYSLGIPNIGLSGAKLICRQLDDEVERLLAASEEELAAIDGVGPVIAASFTGYFADPEKRERFFHLLSELTLEKEETAAVQDLKGKVFVVTGSLTHFSNRAELKELIEKRGGKVTGSVTGKTDYLINNDTESSSSKNKKARELGIPVISEEEFLKL